MLRYVNFYQYPGFFSESATDKILPSSIWIHTVAFLRMHRCESLFTETKKK